MTEIKTEEFELLGQFYVGRRVNQDSKELEELYLYDSRDLLTHAVCIGMTGSGKTGLCLGLLEEAAMDGIPVIAIDPKGDIGNLLLTFPDLSKDEFTPWVSEDEARRENLSVDDYAGNQAELWKNGLEKWGQDAARIRRLRQQAEFSIYTPGSTAGKPVSIVSSFSKPDKAISSDRELLGDRISNVVTSLLSLIGVDCDPLTSREHILLSKILDHFWSQDKDLELTDLVNQVQKPPVTKIGAFDLESFFPSKDRFGLAMAINNLLASPGFEVWMDGESLDIDKLLYTDSGKPRVSIFSINHLNDQERMFFVSLLLNQLVSWMRSQSGSTSLRAMFYMDEIFGYFPPVANPPSKKPLLTLLKQARAFGLGLVLSTQNPGDLDYKGLSNTGTWFIGRLQTERDKQKVLEGLESASGTASPKELGGILSSLGKRNFLVNNVHDDGPEVVQTRWAMSYLRGPLSREEIKRLSSGNGSASTATHSENKNEIKQVQSDNDTSCDNKPALDPSIKEYFLPSTNSSNSIYIPMLLSSGWARFSRTRPPIDVGETYDFLVPFSGGPFPVLWEEHKKLAVDINDLSAKPENGIKFSSLTSAASNPKNYSKWGKEFKDWIYKNRTIDILKSKSLKETSKPNESERDFKIRLQLLAREKRDELLDKLRNKYKSKMSRLESRIQSQEHSIEREKRQAQDATMRSALNIGASILGAFVGRRKTISGNIRRASTAARSASYAANQQGDVAFAEAKLQELQEEMTSLENQFRKDMAELEEQVSALLNEELDVVTIRAKKSDIGVKLLALVWVPSTTGQG